MEDPRLLAGQGAYLDDLCLPGLLHATFVRSPYAHARVREANVEGARSAPGVAAVLSGQDVASWITPFAPRFESERFWPTVWAPLAPERVRFVGEPVAALCAESAAQAADACELVDIGYEPLAVVSSIDAAVAPDAPLLHEDVPGNLLFHRHHTHGDVEGAFARAHLVLRETFRHGRCSASPLEGRGMVAAWEGDRLTVWSGTQVPHIFRSAMARAFQLPEDHVRVVVPDTGGGFGQKMHVLPEDVAVAGLARVAGRPVKWIETRRENLAAASQAREGRVEIEAAADRDGVLLGLRARVIADNGAYHIHPLTAALEPPGTAAILPGPYRTPAYAWEALAVATNKPPLGAYRGVGMTMGAFVMERTLDLLAARFGLDPAEIRVRNLIPKGAYPFTSASGFVYDSGDYPRALAMALELADYEGLKRERDAARGEGRLLGVGVSCYTEYTGIGSVTYRRRGMVEVPGPESARVSLAADGTVRCRLSFSSQGQGHATTAAQLVADELSVALEQVVVSQPDTDETPGGSGTFASRGAIAQCGTARAATVTLRTKILEVAAGLLEVSAADLVIHGVRVSVRGMPDRGVTLSDVAGAVGPARLEVTERFDPPGPTFSGAVHVASVEVDADTGRVTVRRYVVVEDCGPVINPMIVEGQIHGAVAQGIGEALGEELVYDPSGQLLTGSLMDYPLPAAGDVPSFTLGHLETPSPLTPGGHKGMGEGGTIGAPAAIANAVADAVKPLGIEITSLPIRPETLARPTPLP
ncbi:MAG TPA: xanthine dehydrogenase family protein molybdopterin-binding subunit [Methylomirabilota bacterium]|nr:xanthine dehydrogenase family protein molybdopterin-binding subunit [Methylomirabilota bacterium]